VSRLIRDGKTFIQRRKAVAPAPAKQAAIYKFATRVVVCSDCKTTAGVGITTEPYEVLFTPVAATALGEAVWRALEGSRCDLPHPSNFKDLALPRLAAAGVKSEAAFQNGSGLVTVKLDGDSICVTPHQNGGTRGDGAGFSPIMENKICLAQFGNEEVGEAVLRTLELCTWSLRPRTKP
jgi:hypothetical protein